MDLRLLWLFRRFRLRESLQAPGTGGSVGELHDLDNMIRLSTPPASSNQPPTGELRSVAVVRVENRQFLIPAGLLKHSCPALAPALDSEAPLIRIQIDGIKSQTFRYIENHLRTGQFPELAVQNAIDIYTAAVNLGMQKFASKCQEIIYSSSIEDQALIYYLECQRNNSVTDINAALTYLSKTFNKVASSKGITELSEEQLIKLLESPVIKQRPQVERFTAVLRWLHSDCRTRRDCTKSLLSRFDLTDKALMGIDICPELSKQMPTLKVLSLKVLSVRNTEPIVTSGKSVLRSVKPIVKPLKAARKDVEAKSLRSALQKKAPAAVTISGGGSSTPVTPASTATSTTTKSLLSKTLSKLKAPPPLSKGCSQSQIVSSQSSAITKSTKSKSSLAIAKTANSSTLTDLSSVDTSFRKAMAKDVTKTASTSTKLPQRSEATKKGIVLKVSSKVSPLNKLSLSKKSAEKEDKFVTPPVTLSATPGKAAVRLIKDNHVSKKDFAQKSVGNAKFPAKTVSKNVAEVVTKPHVSFNRAKEQTVTKDIKSALVKKDIATDAKKSLVAATSNKSPKEQLRKDVAPVAKLDSAQIGAGAAKKTGASTIKVATSTEKAMKTLEGGGNATLTRIPDPNQKKAAVVAKNNVPSALPNSLKKTTPFRRNVIDPAELAAAKAKLFSNEVDSRSSSEEISNTDEESLTSPRGAARFYKLEEKPKKVKPSVEPVKQAIEIPPKLIPATEPLMKNKLIKWPKRKEKQVLVPKFKFKGLGFQSRSKKIWTNIKKEVHVLAGGRQQRKKEEIASTNVDSM